MDVCRIVSPSAQLQWRSKWLYLVGSWSHLVLNGASGQKLVRDEPYDLCRWDKTSHPKPMGEEPPRGYDYGGFRLFPLNKFNWSDTSDLPSGKLLHSYWKLPFIYSWITHQKQWFSIAMLVYQRVKMKHQKKKHRCMNSVNHQLHPPFCHGPFSSNRMLWGGHHWPGSPTGRPGHFRSGFSG